MQTVDYVLMTEFCNKVGFKGTIYYSNDLKHNRFCIYVNNLKELLGTKYEHLELLKEMLNATYTQEYTLRFVTIKRDFISLLDDI